MRHGDQDREHTEEPSKSTKADQSRVDFDYPAGLTETLLGLKDGEEGLPTILMMLEGGRAYLFKIFSHGKAQTHAKAIEAEIQHKCRAKEYNYSWGGTDHVRLNPDEIVGFGTISGTLREGKLEWNWGKQPVTVQVNNPDQKRTVPREFQPQSTDIKELSPEKIEEALRKLMATLIKSNNIRASVKGMGVIVPEAMEKQVKDLFEEGLLKWSDVSEHDRHQRILKRQLENDGEASTLTAELRADQIQSLSPAIWFDEEEAPPEPTTKRKKEKAAPIIKPELSKDPSEIINRIQKQNKSVLPKALRKRCRQQVAMANPDLPLEEVHKLVQSHLGGGDFEDQTVKTKHKKKKRRKKKKAGGAKQQPKHPSQRKQTVVSEHLSGSDDNNPWGDEDGSDTVINISDITGSLHFVPQGDGWNDVVVTTRRKPPPKEEPTGWKGKVPSWLLKYIS